MTKFPHGSLVQIARAASLSKQYLTHILTGRRQCKPNVAQRLVIAAKSCGFETNQFDWLNPDMTTNPLFKGYQ